MARKLRLEYPGALYHVLNRGNYRSDVFLTGGAKEAFLTCLGEACEKTGWVVHAYVVMRNHYHLALETPAANLVDGMRWLQSTYANRFNRLRDERGHVFQGRYQAIVVEDGMRLGAVAHYIHLNPVRAKVVPKAAAATYRWSSLHGLLKPKERPPWMWLEEALVSAGQLPDTPKGRASYLDFLGWLAGEPSAQKAFGFEGMSRGWSLKEFKRSLLEEQKQVLAERELGEAEMAEVREQQWEQGVAACMARLGMVERDVRSARKSAAWKVAVAAHLRRHTTVKNPWLAARLHVGDPDGVSRYVGEVRGGKRPDAAKLLTRIADIRV
jgi:putative transposase